MPKTRIPWAQYSINPVKGLCPVDCTDNNGKPYCYARKGYRRFKWNPEIRFEEIEMWWDIAILCKGKRVFVGSTIELFGDWVKPEWQQAIFRHVARMTQHTFIFLTKMPQNLPREWPDNCWVGVSTPNASHALKARKHMVSVHAKVKFLSIEPMFDWGIGYPTIWGILSNFQWVILGSRTQPVRHPFEQEVRKIIEAADDLKIPVFVKEPLATHLNIHREEYPK